MAEGPPTGPTVASGEGRAPVLASLRWPRPLTIDEARDVLHRWTAASRRVDPRWLDGELTTRDATWVRLQVDAVVEHRTVVPDETTATSFAAATIPRVPLAAVPVDAPADVRGEEHRFVFADSLRTRPDPVCRGRGEVPCERCSGRGTVACPPFEPCPVCADRRGRGRADGEVCPACHGDARRECSTCGGSGHTVCPVCDGRRPPACAACGGDGQLLLGDVVTVSRTVRSRTAEVGAAPPTRRAREVTGRRAVIDGATVPHGLPPVVEEAVAELLRPRRDEVRHRLTVEVVPATAVDVTAVDGDTTTAVVVGDARLVVAPGARGRTRGRVVLAGVAAVVLAVVVLLATSGLLG